MKQKKGLSLVLVFIGVLVLAGALVVFSRFSQSSDTASLQKPQIQTIPASHTIANVPYYAKKNFCYEASSMMILKHAGVSDADVQKFKTIVDTEGKGGPPDMFLGFQRLGMVNNIHIGYSKAFNANFSRMYDKMMQGARGRKTLFTSEDEAFLELKRLVGLNTPVVALLDHGNHYVVVTGYDERFISVSDPDPDVGVKKMPVTDFLAQWRDYKQDLGKGRGDLGFPGEFGMFWLEK